MIDLQIKFQTVLFPRLTGLELRHLWSQFQTVLIPLMTNLKSLSSRTSTFQNISLDMSFAHIMES
jgi:hypothetical protein